MSTNKKSLFLLADGRKVTFTFFLVASLFLLWGFCNGLIDTMDKHFQDQLHLTKAQSAWVQFAHYMGYALMALPAGLLTRRLGYKGGIISGLMLVALGGFWFMPATSISQFWAFLLGVCLIAMGLAVLETVANPYTTVLGPKQYAATRINLAQSFNGIGWIAGPWVAAVFFYSEGGVQKAHGQLFIPYLGVGIVVLIIAMTFFFAPVPDVKTEDEYHTDDKTAAPEPVAKEKSPFLIFLMLFLNVAVLGLSIYLVLHTILPAIGVGEKPIHYLSWISALVVLIASPIVWFGAKKLSSHSIWAHPHFSGATLAQFVYVAAQAGIFSFFINSMTVDTRTGYSMVPPLPASWNTGIIKNQSWIETRTAFSADQLSDLPVLADRLKNAPDAVSAFLKSHLSTNTLALLAEYSPGTGDATSLRSTLLLDLNRILRQELNKADNKPALYDAERFSAVQLSERTKQLLSQNSEKENDRLRINRMLFHDAFPQALAYNDTILALSDKGASILSSLAFFCFLLGRVSGAYFLAKTPAHRILGLYALVNVGVCALIIGKLGWASVICVFLSYFFMSIMFPTIFAVGIFGLGSQSKKKASAFIVMSITGGALMPKLMGYLGDVYSMSASFLMPMVCFALIGLYALSWPKLSQSDGLHGVKSTGGH